MSLKLDNLIVTLRNNNNNNNNNNLVTVSTDISSSYFILNSLSIPSKHLSTYDIDFPERNNNSQQINRALCTKCYTMVTQVNVSETG